MVRYALLIAGCLLVAAVLSGYSGYHHAHAPTTVLYAFTPLGLLSRAGHDIHSLKSHCSFAGVPSLSMDYFLIFLWTCFLELPFYSVALSRAPAVARFAVLLLANLATHPVVFFAFPRLIGSYLTSVLASEAFAIAVEVSIVLAVLRKFWRDPAERDSPMATAAVICAANLFSWQIGIYL